MPKLILGQDSPDNFSVAADVFLQSGGNNAVPGGPPASGGSALIRPFSLNLNNTYNVVIGGGGEGTFFRQDASVIYSVFPNPDYWQLDNKGVISAGPPPDEPTPVSNFSGSFNGQATSATLIVADYERPGGGPSTSPDNPQNATFFWNFVNLGGDVYRPGLFTSSVGRNSIDIQYGLGGSAYGAGGPLGYYFAYNWVATNGATGTSYLGGVRPAANAPANSGRGGTASVGTSGVGVGGSGAFEIIYPVVQDGIPTPKLRSITATHTYDVINKDVPGVGIVFYHYYRLTSNGTFNF